LAARSTLFTESHFSEHERVNVETLKRHETDSITVQPSLVALGYSVFYRFCAKVSLLKFLMLRGFVFATVPAASKPILASEELKIDNYY
jgi:hypothetical protein